MSALLFLLLCCGSWALFAVSRPGWRGPRPAVPARGRKRGRRTRQPDPDALPRLVRQVAALLAAGRTGPALWGALGQVLAAEHGRGLPRSALPRSTQPAQIPDSAGLPRHGARAGPGAAGHEATLLLIFAVERASTLGLPTALGGRGACRVLGGGGRLHRGLAPQQERMWLDMAACFHVCEASGAPVAGVLERLAATLEAEQDAAALRETALAGPRATVRLLNWLPFLGLALGILMGVDPIAVLLSGPPGWALLAVGLGLVLAGRAWSARMIAAAARNPAAGNRRRRPLWKKNPRAVLGRG